MSAITTHVLDLSRGRPADGVPVVLKRREGTGWKDVARGTTDADGRLKNLMPEGESLRPGTYLLLFDTEKYFERTGIAAFYPEVSVVFSVRLAGSHHHVPLLLSPFGYSTYRGS
jgi:5-hydroxyisourate hydrolase